MNSTSVESSQAKENRRAVIHLVGNAHIDPVWLWPWNEGYQVTRATFRSAIDRIAEFPQFVFTASQAAVYRWVEESEPDLFKIMQEKVKEDRWSLVGGWWMEPDCNIPAGEAFARHSLYSQRYFKQSFGKTCRVGYCVDSFGHNAMLPQLLKQGGMDYYVFMRPNRIENTLCPEGPFWWESADGSRVLTFRLLTGYGTGPDGVGEDALKVVSARFDEQVRDLMFFYGVGDHGGGPTIATIKNLESQQQSQGSIDLKFSSPDHYFESLLATHPELPVYRGELQHHAIGCYAAHSGIKTWNRKAEHLLLAAERWATLGNFLVGTPAGTRELATAWQEVLFNQFHDIMAGTSIREAYEDARDSFGVVFSSARRRLNAVMQRIGSQVDTRASLAKDAYASSLVVFNPHSFRALVPVEHELMVWHMNSNNLQLVDDAGEPVALQTAEISAAIPPSWRKRLVFLADLPPFGFRTYHLTSAADGQPAMTQGDKNSLKIYPVKGPVVNDYTVETDGREDLVLENQHLRLTLDARLGDMVNLYDKRQEKDIFFGHAGVAEVLDDPSDTWSHGLTAFRDVCGRFSGQGLRIVENGPVRLRVRSYSRYGASTLQQDYILYSGQPWIEVRAALDWHEHLKLVKFAFPTQMIEPEATFEIPYGVIGRPTDGKEVPGQRWFDLSAEEKAGLTGLSILNDTVFSYDVQGPVMRMTILRSPAYAHHTPKILDAEHSAGGDYAWMDQGLHEFRYILLPHAGSWQAAGTQQLADILNMPGLSQEESAHPGRLAGQASLIQIDTPNVAAVVLKLAEDGNGLVIRCQERSGIQTEAEINLNFIGLKFSAVFNPWQVKTWLIPSDGTQPVRETNFLED